MKPDTYFITYKNILFAFQISMCDKSRNTWLCVHWQLNTLEWCQLNALQASPVVYLVTPLWCVSLSMNTQPDNQVFPLYCQRDPRTNCPQFAQAYIETVSPEGTFCDTVQIPSSVGDMELI